jgi:ATP-dependent DNA helicase DinG
MENVFAPGGALEQALEKAGDVRFEPRPEQAALAAAVDRALATGEHLVAEAGTGVGKSLAYLVPALESGLRVVVATVTKALQEQLLAKDVPVAAATVGRSVDVQVLKGRANYLCRRQLQGFQPFLLPEGRDARAWEAMQSWLDTTETGDRSELELEPTDAFGNGGAVGLDRCSGRRCPSSRRASPRRRESARPAPTS